MPADADPAPPPAAPPRALIYPSIRDPRWLQLAFLFSFVIYALRAPGFSRSPAQLAAGVATCVLADGALLYFYRRLLLLPVSGLISSMGLLLLCDSPSVWPYPVIGLLAILSKQIIRIRGKHLFNPLNFGIVVALLFLSADMTVAAGRWGGSMLGMGLVACLGVFTVYRAKRLDLSATWLATFALGAAVRSAITGAKLLTVLGPMTGASFALFTFFMITDPMTTPETRRGRVVYAVALGVVDGALRYRQVSFAPFFALFALSGFLPLFRGWFAPAAEERVWAPRALPLGGRSPGDR
jgi:enediyne biosynthesis protein E5